jgi:predicted nucleic acid-binding protein
MQAVVVDTGPLVAYFDRDDQDHMSVHAWFTTQAVKYRLVTTEAVVTEVTHMLDFSVAVQSAFVDWAALAVVVKSVPQANYEEIAQWMRRYAKVPMDFADATVLWAYRETHDSRILTLDQRGFGVFRLPQHGKKRPATIKL